MVKKREKTKRQTIVLRRLKTKEWASSARLKYRVNSCVEEGPAVPAPVVVSVILLCKKIPVVRPMINHEGGNDVIRLHQIEISVDTDIP